MSIKEMTISAAKLPPPIIQIRASDNRALLTIKPDGTVDGEIENASEAARLFVEHIRYMIAEPQTAALHGQLLQECLVKLRDVQGTEASKDYACNLIKRIEMALQR